MDNKFLNVLLPLWRNKDLEIRLKNFKGNIVTRFPPEPSGYLHIGHVKAIFINYIVAVKYNGKMVFRIDDTNPNNESLEYEKAIIEDVNRLGINYDKFTHTSDYFDSLLKYAELLIDKHLAYVDCSEHKLIREQRKKSIENSNRSNSVEKNRELWNKMKSGDRTDCILRLKINMKHKDGAMRDPTLYRCNSKLHMHTKDRYRVYPTYDFACPIVDYLEGVTHVFRSTEFDNRDEQYKFILKVLELKKPSFYSYGKIKFQNTVMSKRKIKDLVRLGTLEGWDDPRLLTVRGVLRRGLTLEGLTHFIARMGFSKNDIKMEHNMLWAINKKYIDKISTRYIAILKENLANMEVSYKDCINQIPNYELIPKIRRFDIGKRPIYYSPNIYIDKEDYQSFKDGEEITLMHWGNMIVRSDNIFEEHLEGDFKKTSKKVLWICNRRDIDLIDITIKTYNGNKCTVRYFVGEPSIKVVKVGDYIQLLKMGYYRCDKKYDNTVILIEIPTK